jgi:hypothetical protein
MASRAARGRRPDRLDRILICCDKALSPWPAAGRKTICLAGAGFPRDMRQDPRVTPRRWDRLTKGRRGHICKRGPKIPADPIASAHEVAGRFMSNVFSTYALVLAVLLVSAAPGAAASLSITVPAGQWLTLPAAGIVRVDTQPADVAIASTDADTVKIFGARPGMATLIVTTADTVQARLIQVVAVPATHLSLVPRAGDCPAPAFIKAVSPSHVALGVPDLALDWTPADWRLEWTPPDVRVLASSALATPLQQLGVPVTPGLQAEWHDEWRLIAGDGLGLVGYHFPGAGTLAVGDSVLGPAGFMDMALGDARVSAVALKSQGGQLLSGAQATVGVGPVNVGYATGPAGGSPTVQLHSGSVSASAGTTASQGLQLGLGVGVASGFTIDSSWTAAGGWRVHVAVAIGGGAVAEAGTAPGGGSASYATIGWGAQDAGCFP